MTSRYYRVTDGLVKRGDVVKVGPAMYLISAVEMYGQLHALAICLITGNRWSDNPPKENKEGNTLEELNLDPRECEIYRRKENA